MNYEKLMSKKNGEGKDAVDLLNEASELMDKDKFKDAIDLLTEAIGMCGHPRFYFNRGYCYQQLKDSKNAIKDFTKCIANDRGNDLMAHEKQRLFLYHGILYEDMGEEEKAIEAYKKAADWGYAGAIARLEKMGIEYTPDSNDQYSDSDDEKEKQDKPVSKSASASGVKGSSVKNAQVKSASSNSAKIKTRYNPFFAAVIGFIFGIILILIVSNLPREAPEKPPAARAAVASNTLNLLSEPSSNAEVLKILYFGNVVDITGEISGNWTPVEYEGIQGWVLSALIVSE